MRLYGSCLAGLVLGRHVTCPFNIGLLALFRSTSKQDDQRIAILRQIDSVSRSPINSIFADDSDRFNDALEASVLSDSVLAEQRGGTETHNQNNVAGTVTDNVASQLTTGSNSISENSFSNSSGIPIVIQNSGNNVLIQNSTILNLQLASPAK